MRRFLIKEDETIIGYGSDLRRTIPGVGKAGSLVVEWPDLSADEAQARTSELKASIEAEQDPEGAVWLEDESWQAGFDDEQLPPGGDALEFARGRRDRAQIDGGG